MFFTERKNDVKLPFSLMVLVLIHNKTFYLSPPFFLLRNLCFCHQAKEKEEEENHFSMMMEREKICFRFYLYKVKHSNLCFFLILTIGGRVVRSFMYVSFQQVSESFYKWHGNVSFFLLLLFVNFFLFFLSRSSCRIMLMIDVFSFKHWLTFI